MCERELIENYHFTCENMESRTCTFSKVHLFSHLVFCNYSTNGAVTEYKYIISRYPPPTIDRFGGGDRYAGSGRYPPNAYGKERDYDRDVGARSSERYGGGGPARYEAKSYRDRAGPYDRPKRGPPSTFDGY